MRPLPRTWRFLAAGVVLTAGLLAGCDLPGFGAPDPASKEGESIWSLWQGFFIAALGVGALVWGLLIFVLVRYRRRNDDIPSQSAYNVPLEVIYTVLPVIAVAVLFGFSVATEREVTGLDDEAAVTVDVIGFQWSWEFRYLDPDGGDDADVVVSVIGSPEDPPELVLPVDQAIHLRLISNDVAHSFWVPDFLSKRDLIPGIHNEIQVTPTEVGTYDGRCAEYCGLDHWRMSYSVRVVSQADYDDWLADAIDEADAPADSTAAEDGP